MSNVDIRPVDLPLVVSKLFGSVNEVDSHNISSQYDLTLEKFQINQCDCLQLCTAVSMGMNITHFWELFRYGVKRDDYEKLIGIR